MCNKKLDKGLVCIKVTKAKQKFGLNYNQKAKHHFGLYESLKLEIWFTKLNFGVGAQWLEDCVAPSFPVERSCLSWKSTFEIQTFYIDLNSAHCCWWENCFNDDDKPFFFLLLAYMYIKVGTLRVFICIPRRKDQAALKISIENIDILSRFEHQLLTYSGNYLGMM